MFLFASSHGVGRPLLWGTASTADDGHCDDDQYAEELFRVTKAEFRRLTRQQEQLVACAPPPAATNATSARWFRPEPHVDASEKIAGYRAELEASARAFCDQKNKWAPLQLRPEAASQPPPWRSGGSGPAVGEAFGSGAPPRPASAARKPTPPSRPATAAPAQRGVRADAKRPLSAIANSRFADEVTYGAYDTLTPDVIHALNIRCDRVGGGSGFSERSCTAVAAGDGCSEAVPGPRPTQSALWSMDPVLTTTAATDIAANGPCDRCRGGDIGSGRGGPPCQSGTSAEQLRMTRRAEAPLAATTFLSGSASSRAARIKERDAMTYAEEGEDLNEDKEPEDAMKGASFYAAGRDRSRYDFEASATAQPDYPFKDALSPSLMAVDFASVAARTGGGDDDKLTALDVVPVGDGVERKIATRLLQLARLQLLTRREEDESRRRPAAEATNVEFARWPSRIRPRLLAAATAAAAAASGAHRRAAAPSSRACCADCLQPACVGDCPEKRPRPRPSEIEGGRGCPLCRRRSCAGGCAAAAEVATPYEAHERRPHLAAAEVELRCASGTASEGVRRAASHRPRSCGARLTRRPAAAAAAMYSTVEAADPAARLTTPASSLSRPSTASGGGSRGGGGCGTATMACSPGSMTPPRTMRCRSARLRGRDSVLPGKSFFSQRRRSLTGCDSSPAKDAAARTVDRQRRARSAKS